MSISNLLSQNNYTIYANKLDAQTSGTVITSTIGLGGAIVATNGNLRYSKHGKIIYITFEAVTGNKDAGNQITSTAPIPADYRPSYEIWKKIIAHDNGADVVGTIKIETNGNITIYNGTEGNFTAGVVGYKGFGIKYDQQ